jgi:hypothetical protein
LLLTTDITVKPLLKFLSWEDDLRSTTEFVGEGHMTFGMLRTWSDSKINRCRENYKKRIAKGKVKVFYIDLVKHTLDEMTLQIEKGPGTIIFDKHSWIRKVNKYYRLSTYYDAIAELAPNHISPE